MCRAFDPKPHRSRVFCHVQFANVHLPLPISNRDEGDKGDVGERIEQSGKEETRGAGRKSGIAGCRGKVEKARATVRRSDLAKGQNLREDYTRNSEHGTRNAELQFEPV